MIREYRALEAKVYMLHNELFCIERELDLRKKQIAERNESGELIDGFYALYRNVQQDYFGMRDCYERKQARIAKQTKRPHGSGDQPVEQDEEQREVA
jgi:ABC-type transporter lipoprotein component MlaA